ncbi:MAG TPA: peptide chain release factor N(5)-glutamine methyltransferase, partial [Firmicutes bacterium]|nr:peptide chain release factor N(5)-glutamine methyltransferase [Bacillota bacterium]
MGELLTTGELLRRTTRYFEEKGLPSPRLDAEVLLAWALGCERVDLYVNYDRPLEPDEVARYRELVGRRAKRVPVAFLRGFKEFFALPFAVSPAVLIPRPETETLVQVALEWLAEQGAEVTLPTGKRLTAQEPKAGGWTLADVGTGSGCIAVTVAKCAPGVRVIATDRSPDALAVAQTNAERHGVADRVTFLAGDGPEPLFAGGWAGRLDAVLSNPPYIPTPVLAELAQDIAYEPREALDGGPDGLDFYRRWLPRFAALLRPGGLLAVEIGHDQGAAVPALAGGTGV